MSLLGQQLGRLPLRKVLGVATKSRPKNVSLTRRRVRYRAPLSQVTPHFSLTFTIRREDVPVNMKIGTVQTRRKRVLNSLLVTNHCALRHWVNSLARIASLPVVILFGIFALRLPIISLASPLKDRERVVRPPRILSLENRHPPPRKKTYRRRRIVQIAKLLARKLSFPVRLLTRLQNVR